MKTIIAGGRDFNNWELLRTECDRINISEVVSGKAQGADLLGECYAAHRNLPVTVFPADWFTHGRAAGPIRNQQMADYAEQLIAFWDGKSKGTGDMIRKAKEKGLIVKIVRYGDSV